MSRTFRTIVDGVRELRLVEACHHLVEQQHLGLARECLRHLEEALLVEVQARNRLAGSLVQPDERQRLGRPLPRFPLAQDAVLDAEHRAEESVLENRHRSERKRPLHGHRDPLAPDLMGGETVDPRTVEQDAAACRPLQSDDELQERALSGPVRTDDGDDVAVVDPERHAVDGRETAEALRDRRQPREADPSLHG